MPPVPGIGGRAGSTSQIAKRFPTAAKQGRLPGRFETIPQFQKRLTQDPSWVRDIQKKLRAAGFNVAVDGRWGPQTSSAYHSYTFLARQKGVTLFTKGAQSAVSEYQKRVKADQERFAKELASIQRSMRGEDALTRELTISRFVAGFQGQSDIFRDQADRAARQVRVLADLETKQAANANLLTRQRQQEAAARNSLMGKATAFAGRALGLADNPALEGIIDFASRFGYAFTRAEDLQSANDLQHHKGGLGIADRAQQALGETFERMGTSLLAGFAGATRTASLLPDGSFAQQVAEATDDRLERELLVEQRIMETPGQRFAREAIGFRDERREAIAAAGARGLKGGVAQAFVDQRIAAAKRAFELSAGRPDAGFGRLSYKGHPLSAISDLAFQMTFDPLLLLGKGLRPLLLVSNPQRAARLLATSGGGAIVYKAATQAAKAGAERNVNILLKTVKGLDNAAATESGFVNALTDSTGDAARAFLSRAARPPLATDPSYQAVLRRSNRARALLSDIGDGSLTHIQLQKLLELGLGVEWKPLVQLGTRAGIAAGEVAAVTRIGTAEGIQETMERLPLWTRTVLTKSQSYQLRRSLRPGPTEAKMVKHVTIDPRQVPVAPYLKQFAEKGDFKGLSELLDKVSRQVVGTTKKGKPKLGPAKSVYDMAARQANAASWLETLPASGMRDALIRRLEGVRLEFSAELDRIEASLTAAQRALFRADPEYLKAKRAVNTASALKTFGTEFYAKWAAAIHDLAVVMERAGSMTLPTSLHRKLATLERDIAMAQRIPQEAFDLSEQAFLRDLEAYREAQRYGLRPTQYRNVLAKSRARAAKVLLSPFDMFPTKLTLSVENIEATGKMVLDYARFLGSPEAEAGEAQWRVMQAARSPMNKVEDIQATVNGLVEAWARRMGHTDLEIAQLMAMHADSFRTWLRENAPGWTVVERGRRRYRYGRSGMEYKSTGTGPHRPGDNEVYGVPKVINKTGEDVLEPLESPQAATQMRNFVGMVDPDQLKVWSDVTQMRRMIDQGMDPTGAALVSGYMTTWAAAAASSVLWPVHRFWKWTVLTLAAPRYVLRITLEEKTRAQIAQGAGPAFAIGVWARRQNDYLLQTQHAGFGNWSRIGMDEVPDYFHMKKLARGGDYRVILPDEAGFHENLWHLLNRQVNPESESVAGYMLGVLWREGTDEWDVAYRNAVEWLRSAQGRPHLSMYRSMNGAVDAEDVVEKWVTWARSIVTDDSVAQRRLDGLISMKEVQAFKAEQLPAAVYGRPLEGGPVDIVRHPWKTLERATFESGTTGLTRQPFAFIEYQKELHALSQAGVPWSEADRLANAHAIKRTNDIMFDAGRRSVFAQKMELVFPFQSAREEQLRVAGKLLKERPTAAAATYARYARLFSHGVHSENSPLVKDQYGEWRFRFKVPEVVPGIARWWADISPEWVPFDGAIDELADSQALKNMEMSFRVRDLFMTLPMELPLFSKNLVLQYVAGAFIPTLGGPWFSAGFASALATNPELFPKNGMLREWLMPAGPPLGVRPDDFAANDLISAVIGRPEARYLLGALTGGGWSDRENDELANKMARELYFRLGRVPTADEVERATRGAFALKFFFGIFTPAAVSQQYAGQLEFQRQIQRYTQNGEINWRSMLTFHPELLPYVNDFHSRPIVKEYQKRYGKNWWKELKARDPEQAKALLITLDTEDWKNLTDEEEWAAFVASRKVMEPDQYRKVLEEAKNYSDMLRERQHIFDLLDPWERIDALRGWERKWSDEPAWADMKKRYDKDVMFDTIMGLPLGARRTELEAWRVGNGITQAKFDGYMEDWRAGIRQKSIWAEARTFDEIDQQWSKQQGMSAETFVKEELTPAEAVKWLENKMRLTDDLDEFWKFYGLRTETYSEHKDELFSSGDRVGKFMSEGSEEWGLKRKNVGSQLGKLNGEIDALMAKRQKLFDKMAWAKENNVWVDGLGDAIRQFSKQLSALYAQKKALNDSIYNTVPHLNSVQDEVRLMKAYRNWEDRGHAASSFDFRRQGFDTYDGLEERRWNYMPQAVQGEYVKDLRDRLDQPSGKGKLFWDWLTNWQRDTLRDSWMVDDAAIDKWKRQQPGADGGAGSGGRGRWSRWKRFEWKVWGHTLGDGFGELAFALEMFNQYNRRPEGMVEPKAELAELKRIGENPVLRAEFLRTHPKARAWIAAGPMMNMPPGVAEIVRHVMTKYGRWEDDSVGGPATWNDVIQVGFARTILQQYTQRKPFEQAPHTYELWLKMPSGKMKADYLVQHPEIERWLQRGPMANMPEAYQEVVRDIMTKYGLWTQTQDPMSKLMEQFFALPSYARDAFLQKHPELVAYWRALRTGRDRQMFDLAQRYFAMKTPEDKRAFMDSHPELQEYFAEERRRRYERFLRLVARTLGDYPELAKQYLADQTGFIKELVDRWGERPLIVESARVRSAPTSRDEG